VFVSVGAAGGCKERESGTEHSMSNTMRLQFQLNWKLSLFSFALLPILLSLGVWQLSRAQQKQTLQESWQHQQALPALPYRGDTAFQNRRYVVSGQFVTDRYWLLENRMLDSKLGYEVLMAFRVGEHLLLVNRGWVAAGQYRQDSPQLVLPVAEQRLSGTLKQPSDSRFIEQSYQPVTQWPQRLLEVDTALMASQFGEPLAAHILLLDPDSPTALAVNWQPINMSPAKHTGYAVQWFAMALALTVLWCITNTNILMLIRRQR